jgi:hypothetical protein
MRSARLERFVRVQASVEPIRRVLVLVAAAALVGCATTAPAQEPIPSPATERPLLGAPDPAGPTQRGVFLKDPKGQVERLAAGGHLVAWSVRTPADTHRNRGAEGSTPPKAMPRTSKVVIADERGGAPLSVGLGRRWVAQLRLVRGPGGPAQPQLAVRSCASRTEKRCTDEVIALTTDTPPRVAGRTTGTDATAALEGRLDSGRRLGADGKSCAARLSVREPDATTRSLPSLPRRDRQYTRCRGLSTLLIYGRYAFASVMREWPRYSFDAEFFYGIDLAAGPSARWAEVARPYRGTEGGAALGIGPAVTDQALYWEEYDSVEERIYSLDQVALPRDIEREPTIHTPNTTEPIAPDAGEVCDIAATDGAIYELANPRCALGYGDGRSGEVRRVVNPEFRPQEG